MIYYEYAFNLLYFGKRKLICRITDCLFNTNITNHDYLMWNKMNKIRSALKRVKCTTKHCGKLNVCIGTRPVKEGQRLALNHLELMEIQVSSAE